jgi:DNA-binding GntR family transcriptional regulator
MAIESVTEASPRATAAERVFEALRGSIVGGELLPGAPLTEVEQASRLGVSRTPIREAFARLIAAGLATERGPRTLVVSDIDADDVTALFDLRRALDEQAARLVAQRANTGQRAQFTILAQRFADAPAAIAALTAEDPALTFDDPARNGYYALVAEFDAALDLALTNSPYLAAAIASTRIHLTRVRRLAQDDDARLAASAAEHGAIARAIADGDPERAAAATRLHLHEALTSIRTRLPRSGDSTQETP